MKKFKSELMKVIYNDAKDYFKNGLISSEELQEYEKDCCVSSKITLPLSFHTATKTSIVARASAK